MFTPQEIALLNNQELREQFITFYEQPGVASNNTDWVLRLINEVVPNHHNNGEYGLVFQKDCKALFCTTMGFETTPRRNFLSLNADFLIRYQNLASLLYRYLTSPVVCDREVTDEYKRDLAQRVVEMSVLKELDDAAKDAEEKAKGAPKELLAAQRALKATQETKKTDKNAQEIDEIIENNNLADEVINKINANNGSKDSTQCVVPNPADPMLYELIQDPVRVKSKKKDDTYKSPSIYERSSIVKWLEEKSGTWQDPITRTKLLPGEWEIIDDIKAKKEIQRVKQEVAKEFLNENASAENNEAKVNVEDLADNEKGKEKVAEDVEEDVEAKNQAVQGVLTSEQVDKFIENNDLTEKVIDKVTNSIQEVTKAVLPNAEDSITLALIQDPVRVISIKEGDNYVSQKIYERSSVNFWIDNQNGSWVDPENGHTLAENEWQILEATDAKEALQRVKQEVVDEFLNGNSSEKNNEVKDTSQNLIHDENLEEKVADRQSTKGAQSTTQLVVVKQSLGKNENAINSSDSEDEEKAIQPFSLKSFSNIKNIVVGEDNSVSFKFKNQQKRSVFFNNYFNNLQINPIYSDEGKTLTLSTKDCQHIFKKNTNSTISILKGLQPLLNHREKLWKSLASAEGLQKRKAEKLTKCVDDIIALIAKDKGDNFEELQSTIISKLNQLARDHDIKERKWVFWGSSHSKQAALDAARYFNDLTELPKEPSRVRLLRG